MIDPDEPRLRALPSMAFFMSPLWQ
jgi:hypothetical protein